MEMQRVLSIRADRLQSLGKMAAGNAHELNQPLVGVRGLAEHMML
jgi:C4-dicarboxylate-specific signal transduction histidine kinase